jgi:hypothetical protein
MLVFESRAGLVKELVEMLAPLWATKECLQPFRFIDLSERSQRRLDESLSFLLGKRV